MNASRPLLRATTVALVVACWLAAAGGPVSGPLAVSVASAQANEPVPDQGAAPAPEADPAGATSTEPQGGEVATGRESPWEQFTAWVGRGGNEAVLRLLLWLFDKLVIEFARWVGGVITDATGAHLGPGQSIAVQLPRALTVDADWVRGSYGVFQRLVNAGLYGVFLAGLVTAATGGLLGFTVAEGKEVVAVTVLVWYANRRALEIVTHLVDLANTAAAQFADVTQMLPGYQHLSDLQRGSGEGLNAIITGLFGLFLVFVRWATLFGVNTLVILMPLALLAAAYPPTRGYFSLWWRALAGLVFSQVGIALLLGQAQALSARWGAGGAGTLLLGTCACLWLAAKVPRMLGGLAGMPARAADSATGTARQMALAVATGMAGGATAAKLATIQEVRSPLAGHGGTVSEPQPGPTYRSQPLIPAPLLSLPRPATVIEGEGVEVR
jgi:hypothetical protein